MPRAKQPSAIGLSMLDLISNSLAAVIILFIIISSLKVPVIPPERIKGTLFIRYELRPDVNYDMAESKIWVEPPRNHALQKNRYWEEEIFKMNADVGVFGLFSDCGGDQTKRVSKNFVTPCAMAYSHEDSTNVHYLVIRDPVKGIWQTGLLYRDHVRYPKEEVRAEINIHAWFVGTEQPGIDSLRMRRVKGPTAYYGIEVETPDWKNIK
ncbi:MAG: hypothetical protein AAFQ83_17485 [Bacteroidota bacterium]